MIVDRLIVFVDNVNKIVDRFIDYCVMWYGLGHYEDMKAVWRRLSDEKNSTSIG